MATFRLSRGTQLCAVCDQRVVFSRLICITCIEEDMTNEVNLCLECMESHTFIKARRYVYHLSHSLIRTLYVVHFAKLPIIIPKARLLSERIKASIKASEDKKNSTKDRDSKALKGSDSKATKDINAENIVTSRPSLMVLVCACWIKDVTLPCWACITCGMSRSLYYYGVNFIYIHIWQPLTHLFVSTANAKANLSDHERVFQAPIL